MARSLLWIARVLLSSRHRMAGEPDRKQEGGDVPLYVKWKRGPPPPDRHGWPTGRPRMAQPVHVPTVSFRELTGTTALKAWSPQAQVKMVDFPVVQVVLDPQAQVMEAIEIPQLQISDNVVDMLAVCATTGSHGEVPQL